MQVVSEFPRKVRLIDNLWVPMSDGIRLAAKVWLPEDADDAPVPVILDYIPYRKRDGSVLADERMFPYFAGHGYACVRLDIRGTGDSEGLFEDEYVAREQTDGAEAIAWLAAQRWCCGTVGMIGISWGGFSALQVAALRPPALKAIITHCSTDDRYADDVHYAGGCVLNDTFVWGTSLFTRSGLPPDPAIVGEDRWRQMWMARLQAVRPTLIDWLQHQRRDAFWKQGSVCEDYSAIDCAVYATGGWADGYSNAVFRLLANLRAPAKGLVGPWGHKYPHEGVPGPAIGFLQESLRWWDHWLKGIDTGIMREPMLRAWLQGWATPIAFQDTRPGRWVTAPAWPPEGGAERMFQAGGGLLVDAVTLGAAQTVQSPADTGLAGGEWCAFGLGGLGPELPIDQRIDDARSTLFDSAPLTSELAVLGAPVFEADIRCSHPTAVMAVRLCDVAPSGGSVRVSYGLLNLSHRDGHETPEPLAPGQTYRIRLPLNDAGHIFAQGSRIRLAVSTAYWPIALPGPDAATVTLVPGTTRLTLPVHAEPPGQTAPAAFAPPEISPPLATTVLASSATHRTITSDLMSGRTIVSIAFDGGRTLLNGVGTTVSMNKTMEYSILPEDPTSLHTKVTYRYSMERGSWRAEVSGRTDLTATREAFHLDIEFDANEAGQPVFRSSWSETIPRELT